MSGKEAGEGVGLVEDEEIVAVGAGDFGDGVGERIISVEIVKIAVEVFVGAVGFFDF